MIYKQEDTIDNVRFAGDASLFDKFDFVQICVWCTRKWAIKTGCHCRWLDKRVIGLQVDMELNCEQTIL